jgi:hypothetical protein
LIFGDEPGRRSVVVPFYFPLLFDDPGSGAVTHFVVGTGAWGAVTHFVVGTGAWGAVTHFVVGTGA